MGAEGTSRGSVTTRLLAPNPGPMTLEGTNTYLLRGPAARGSIVVDPGPIDADHQRAILGSGPVELILLTHHHLDHSESAHALSLATGAPVRAADPRLCRDAEPLVDDEIVSAAGVELRVLSTPGHTSDSVCFLVDAGGPERGVVLTGDTILGRGTSVVAHPDGSLAEYLASLERLAACGSLPVRPGHGPELDDLRATATRYLAHRRHRIRQVADAVERLERAGSPVTPAVVARMIYPAPPGDRWDAAEMSVRAHLAYLGTVENGR